MVGIVEGLLIGSTYLSKGIVLSANTVLESALVGSTIGVLSVSGKTGFTFTKSVDPSGKFVISGANLNLAAGLDYETATSHTVTVTATKAGETTLVRTFTILVVDVADTLAALSGTFVLAENAGSGAVAGAIFGKTSGSTLSVIDSAGSRVALSGLNIVRGVTGLDYETTTSHSFTVRETLGGTTRDTALALTVTDIDEVAPTITSANPSGTYSENIARSGTLTANETVTWSKSGTDQALITLNSSTGAWSITSVPDYEAKTSYSWTFTATDGAGNSSSQNVAVTITDVAEGPVQSNLVLVGDSIGAGSQGGGNIAFSMLALGPNVAVTNLSVSATTVQQALDTAVADSGSGRIQQLFDAAKGRAVVIQRGTNDFVQNNVTGSQLYAVMTSLVTLYKTQGFRVAVETTLPRSDANWNTTRETNRTSFNTLVRGNAAGADLIIDSASDPVIGDGTNTDLTTYYADKLHLNAAGQTRKSDIYKAALPNLLSQMPRERTLADLTLSNTTVAAGSAFSATIAKRMFGTTITASSSDGTALSVVGSTVSGNFAAAGTPQITLVETGTGAGNSPKSTVIGVTVSAGAASVESLTLTDPVFGGGKFGSAMIGGRATVPVSVQPLNGGTLPFTAEAWVKPSGVGAAASVAIGQNRTGDTSFSWYLGMQTTGNAHAAVFSGSTRPLATTILINDGAYHHLALVVDVAETRFYVDGVLAGTIPYIPIPNSVAYIRSLDANKFPWPGEVDEVAFFDGAKYTDNFTPPTAPYAAGVTNARGIYQMNGNGSGIK